MIKVVKIIKKYKDKIIDNFSFEFRNKGFYSIVGSSGSGKSTLLNIISGVDKKFLGDVFIDDINIRLLSNEDNSKFRLTHIGNVFQDFRLLNSLNVYDNVQFNLDAAFNLSKEKKDKLIKDTLNFVSLNNKIKTTVNNLSGGEKQRVAIARAIITSPKYLLCDEPTGSLDEKNSVNIFQILKKYSENHTVIVVTHDREKALKYSDQIIELKDGGIVNNTIINKIDDNNIHRISFIKKDNVSLSHSLRLNSGINKIKEKKFRFLFTNLISSFSLLFIGLGILISSSLKSQINDSFTNVIDSNEIIVSKKTDNPNPYSSYISADEEIVKNIVNDYESYTYGMGISYVNDFNNFFVDRDQVYIIKNNKKIILNSYYSKKFSNYIWYEDRYVERFYPQFDHNKMELSDLVLGLTYIDMINLCISLEIERTYDALGAYLKTHEVRLFLGIDNLSWGYENDLEFRLLSVYPSIKSEIMHNNHYFNSYVFEIESQLPTTDEIESEPEFPWTLKKVYNLHLYESSSYLNESLILNDKYKDIVIENFNSYFDDKCIATGECEFNIVFVFLVDKNAIFTSDIIQFKKISSAIKNYYFSTTSGYQKHSSGLISGFVNNLGFSFSEDKIIEVGDYFAKEIEGEMEEFPGVAIGGITSFNENSVLFSSDLQGIIKGELPKNYNEIIVSTNLLKYLDYKGNPLYERLYYCVYFPNIKSVVINTFKIVGVIKSEKNYIYHNPLFSISFFRDRLGISSFNLLPTNVVLSIDKNVSIDRAIQDLSSSFKEYNFVSPLKEMGKTVDEVMDYVIIISTSFSFISLFISILLLSLTSYLDNLEAKKDIELMVHLGHSKKSIREYITSHSLVTSFLSTIFAIIELFISEIFISMFVSEYFTGNSTININIMPIFIVIIVGVFLPLIISNLITFMSLKKLIIK